MLQPVGMTTDGKTVLAGVYKTFETHGIPLDILFQTLQVKNAIPCWISFHREAQAAGMKHTRIMSKLDEALSDVYGPAFRDHVLGVLRIIFG